MNAPDPALLPFVGTRDDFRAYLRELGSAERLQFLSEMPPSVQEIARHMIGHLAGLVPEYVHPAKRYGARRFQIVNAGAGGERIYLLAPGDYTEAEQHANVRARALEIWRRFGIRTSNVVTAPVPVGE